MEESLMNVARLSEYLKVNSQTIYNWVSQSQIPHIKIGNVLRFKKSDIDGWIKKRTAYPDRLRYKEFEIEATPYQLADSKKWILNIIIWKHKGRESVSVPFNARNSFDSKQEAIRECFIFGRKIIDGEIENCSVDYM